VSNLLRKAPERDAKQLLEHCDRPYIARVAGSSPVPTTRGKKQGLRLIRSPLTFEQICCISFRKPSELDICGEGIPPQVSCAFGSTK